MAVAPCNLLQSTPEAPPSAFATPARPPDSGSAGAADFREVYARQQAANPPERSEQPRRNAHRDRQTEDRSGAVEQAPADDTASPVAERGNALPADGSLADADATDLDEAPLDPLGLMEQLDQPPVPLATPPALPPGEPASGAELLAGLFAQRGVQPPLATDPLGHASDAAARDALAGLALPGPTLDGGRPATAWTHAETAGAAALGQQVTDAAGGDFGATLEAMGEQALEALAERLQRGADAEPADFDLAALAGGGQESPGDPPSDPLHALGQALTPGVAAAAAQRAAPALALYSSGFSEAVVERVMWMSSQNLKSADIQLDPDNLGRLEVRVHLDQDQTQVTFSSANQAVRDTLESQLHRLRDLFSQQGMNLADVSVSDQSLSRGGQDPQAGAQGQPSRGGHGMPAQGGPVPAEQPALGHPQVTALEAGRGLVDYYA